MSFHSFRKVCLLPVNAFLKTRSVTLSQHKDSQYLVFTGWLPVHFLPLFILSADHTDRKWPWYDDVLASSVHSCSQAEPALYYLCHCLLHAPESRAPTLLGHRYTDLPDPRSLLETHFVVPFAFLNITLCFPQFIIFNWCSLPDIIWFGSSYYVVYIYLFYMIYCFVLPLF